MESDQLCVKDKQENKRPAVSHVAVATTLLIRAALLINKQTPRCSARAPLSQGSHTGECYLRQFVPQVVSGRVAVHVTQQVVLETQKGDRK